YQGLRFDFFYEHKEHKNGEIFMIWPEFEDESGQVILKNDFPVGQTGTARMFIISEQWIEYHRGKIKLGTIGYFMEGKRIAECEVIELITI
ncbi:MAG TPA: hypothetical protein VEW65_08215, partial [Chryseolinea sp.]|nr:hypothetical protein [Chryseolinea sp.]